MAKVGMSLCTLGLAQELRGDGIGVNSLWPLTTIDTAAVRNVLGGEAISRRSRSPRIMADAAHVILSRPARECTGNFFIDEEVLREAGVTEFSHYAPHADGPLVRDLFVPDAVVDRVPTRVVDLTG
jgi:citronellol/citronellal dehydrogenase